MGSVIGYQEAHGPIATFETDVAGMIKSLAVDINPVQSGTGSPSSDNPRPITGWTNVNASVNGNVINVTFPSAAGTVYGGTLDVVNGVLTVDKTIVDLGTLDWSKSNLTYFKSDSLKSVIEVPVGQKTPADMVCSKYVTLSYSQVYAGSVSGIAVIGDTSANDKGLLTINDLALVDSAAEDFKASLSGTMLAYKVKSPTTYSLTPREINTIVGTNTIYADTGDVSVLYPKTLTPAETVSNVNLMELRRGIIAGAAKPSLPYPYRKVQYIQSYGEQYIDTLINSDSTCAFSLDVQFNTADAIQLFGNTGNSGSTQFRSQTGIDKTGGLWTWYWGLGNKSLYDTEAADTSRHTLYFDFFNRVYGVDNRENTMPSDLTMPASPVSILLFVRQNEQQGKERYCNAKLYGAMIKKSGIEVAHFVPCYNKSTDEVGLYDTVRKQFFGNLGTGAFTKGPNT